MLNFSAARLVFAANIKLMHVKSKEFL